MDHRVGVRQVSDRYEHYFMDQQVGLHNTITSVALGVAGLAAAGLVVVSAADRPYHALFWLLWAVSLTGVATVYSGMVSAVHVAPSRIPSAPDMFLPFAIGLMEFMLFAVLTAPLSQQISPRAIVAIWFGVVGLFGCFAVLAIGRVRWLMRQESYEPSALQTAINALIGQLRTDMLGAGSCAALGAGAALLFALARAVSLAAAYPLAALIAVGMVVGLVNQHRQGRALEAALREAAGPASQRPASATVALPGPDGVA
jgi:hypothetical protein